MQGACRAGTRLWGHALQLPDTVAKRKTGLSVVHSGGIGGRRATSHAAAAHTASQSQADRRTDANAFEDSARRRPRRAAINDDGFVVAALLALVGALGRRLWRRLHL